MKNLLKSIGRTALGLIVHGDQRSAQLADETVQQGIDNVIAGTESQIGLVPGYRKKLRPAVITSLKYIDELVETIPGPLDVNKKTFFSDPQVNAYFATEKDLQNTFAGSEELKAFFRSLKNIDVNHAYALLCMSKDEKTTFGTELVENILQREVAQTAVNFSDHEVLSAAASEEEIRQHVKECIFDGLLSYASQQLSDIKVRKQSLEDRRRILYARQRSQRFKSSGLSALLASAQSNVVEDNELAEKIALTEQEIKQMPVFQDAPREYLNEVNAILLHPEEFIRMKSYSCNVTRMGIKVSDSSSQQGQKLEFTQLIIKNVLKRVVVIIRYPRNGM